MNKAQQIDVVIKKYEVALKEYKKAQSFYKRVSNPIDQRNMTAAQALALAKARQILSDVSKRFYIARAEYKTDMSRLLADEAIKRVNEYSFDTKELTSDEALAMAILSNAKQDIQGDDIDISQGERDIMMKEGFGKTELYKDQVRKTLITMRGKLGPDQLALKCECGHTYKEHMKVEGFTRCSNKDCMCAEFVLNTDS